MILKEFYHGVQLCRTWNDNLVYHKVMATVESTQCSKDIDFREDLCYGITQRMFLIQRQIEMDDDNSDENAAKDEDTRMEHNT